MEDFHTNLLFFLRWIHILAGITWIGHLYFFNFVNVPFQAAYPKEMKSAVNPALLPRALWWFRWGAMVTFLVGLLLLIVKYGHPGTANGLWVDAEGVITGRAIWITIGALLGTIMWFNVWFVIWPAQKQLITWTRDKQSPPEMAGLAKRALLFSRTNTYLSGPMLFCMIAPNNYGGFSIVTFLVVTVIAVGTIYSLIKLSAKVGTAI